MKISLVCRAICMLCLLCMAMSCQKEPQPLGIASRPDNDYPPDDPGYRGEKSGDGNEGESRCQTGNCWGGGTGSGDATLLLSLRDFNTGLDLFDDDPTRPHITVKINNPCQAEALRKLVNAAQLAQVEYNNSMNNCLVGAGFGAVAVNAISNGGFYKLILGRMRIKGVKGKSAYTATLVETLGASIAASSCINSAYDLLQTKYTGQISDFNAEYNKPCP